MRRDGWLAGVIAMLCAGSAMAQGSADWLPIPQNAVYQTGDSWIADGATYRLYGVQACIRGTSFTNAAGVKRDCGETSLAMLIALVRDLQPQCHIAARSPDARTIFVFCIAAPTKGASAGSRIDLGTALISTGYAFASLKPDGTPAHAPYFVAQLVAQRSKAGLWAFANVPEPNTIIFSAMRREAVKKTTADRNSGSSVSRSMP